MWVQGIEFRTPRRAPSALTAEPPLQPHSWLLHDYPVAAVSAWMAVHATNLPHASEKVHIVEMDESQLRKVVLLGVKLNKDPGSACPHTLLTYGQSASGSLCV